MLFPVMAGLVPATQEHERSRAGFDATPSTIVIMGRRDKPGGDGLA